MWYFGFLSVRGRGLKDVCIHVLCRLRKEKSMERFEFLIIFVTSSCSFFVGFTFCVLFRLLGFRFWEFLVQVIMGLTDEELRNLDAVEGNEFERVTVGVVREVSLKNLILTKTTFRWDWFYSFLHVQDNSEKMPVKTYIWINKNDPDLDGEWDFEV